MTITICQLYANLMSTYGDRGNVLYLKYFLGQLGHTVRLRWHYYGEPIPKATIYVFGGGQDAAQTLVAFDLQGQNGRNLTSYLAQSYCLAVCGGYQLLGRYYLSLAGELLPGLSYLPVGTVGHKQRLVGHVVAMGQYSNSRQTLVGFENHGGRTYILDDSPPLATVLVGGGNNGIDKTEGIVYGRTLGTYLHGPILPRNPHLAHWWLRSLTDNRVGAIPQAEKQAHRALLQKLSWY